MKRLPCGTLASTLEVGADVSRGVPSGSDAALGSGRSPKVPGKGWPSSAYPLLLHGVHQSLIYGPFSYEVQERRAVRRLRGSAETSKRFAKPDRQLRAQQHQSLPPTDEYTARIVDMPTTALVDLLKH